MEEHKKDRVQEDKIDFLPIIQEFWKALRRLFYIPLILAVAYGAYLGVQQWRSYTPMYESTVTFTVHLVSSSKPGDTDSSTEYYDQTAAEQLGKTFPYLLQSDLMRHELKAATGESSFNGSISANCIENTNMFTLRVTGTDPEAVYDTLKTVIKIYPKVADYVVGRTNLTLLTKPAVATTPYNEFHSLRTICKGAFEGFAAGIALLFLFSLTRKTIRTPNDVKKRLGQKCIAVIPRVTLKQQKKDPSRAAITLRNKHIAASFQENIRSLRIKFLKEMQKNNRKVLLVTSTIPGEGKSTVAANLALSLSRSRYKVILVDLDLRKPVVKKTLGVNVSSLGVADLLKQHPESLAPYLVRVDDTNLYLLAGDTPVSNVHKAVNSDALYRMIETLRSEADFIILDTPPSGILADSVSASRCADAALYVLGAGLVEAGNAADGIQFLSSADIPLLGCVLNGAKVSHSKYGYGSGYGYGNYGGYGHYGAEKRDGKLHAIEKRIKQMEKDT